MLYLVHGGTHMETILKLLAEIHPFGFNSIHIHIQYEKQLRCE